MNLQHWIDQHPAAFAAIFPIYFLYLWFLVGAIISVIGGWFALAKVYRTREPFNGAKWRMQSGQLRWRLNYNNVLTIGASPEGLYLASMFLFRFMHAPLLVPWSEIRVRRTKGWVFEYVTLTIGHELGQQEGRVRHPFLSGSCKRGRPDMNPADYVHEVKSPSPIDRFLIVFHSPDGMTETGLLLSPPEKMRVSHPRHAWWGFLCGCGFENRKPRIGGDFARF